MSEGGSLVNIGELARPATVLIERVSDAVGGIAKPWQTVRTAKAEAKAEIIRAEAQLEISDMQRRAIARMITEEGQRQENIESITAKAIPHLKDDAKPEDVERDWLTHFFDRSRLVSDEEMQSLWANILAGEANRPGSFSKRTVELIGTLDKKDAQLFTKFCSCVWQMGWLVPLVYDVDHEVYRSIGLDFSRLSHLDTIGLITFNNVVGYRLQNFGKYTVAAYYGAPVHIEFAKDKNNDLQIGKALLTQAGQELAKISGSTRSEECFSYVLSKSIGMDLILSTPVDPKRART